MTETWLVEKPSRLRTPNVYRPGHRYVADVEVLVLHYTVGRTALGAARWLCNPDARASAHFVVGPEDTLQLAPLEERTWHAGGKTSAWRSLRGGYLNGASVGIEIDNLGKLSAAKDARLLPAPALLRDAYLVPHEGTLLLASGGVVDAYKRPYAGPVYRHEDGTVWQPFEQATADRVLALVGLLVDHFPRLREDDAGSGDLPRIVGHEEVDPSRKIDPGPAFPLDLLRYGFIGGP